ncbi:MAG: PHP domain-containing protein [Jatrophihabitans sp.]|uniref:PHP domain-containing protein n=1 Tax=Jatrophihabitans sp. TaxID=1932789 RepID=UPI003F7D54D3
MRDHHGHPHHHDHPHDHPHDHTHEATPSAEAFAEATDLTVPDRELSPSGLARRTFLRSAGLLGAGAAASAVFAGPAAADGPKDRDGEDDRNRDDYLWLSGDHHIHTQYSPDAQYRVDDQVRHANQYGLDWMVITDHGSVAHAKLGVEKVNPDIVAARQTYDTLVFQGLEWNIPAAEHGTVFVAPSRNEVSLLKQFENGYDGTVNGAGSSTPTNEALAIAGIKFLGEQVRNGVVADALMLANHPARKGIDSPHEFRNWRDADPTIAVGMEGAPGHQAAGIKAPSGPGGGRGEYNFSPNPDSFAGYPLASYRTWGGFDWFTATVGGLWDSLLAEGKAWWITSNSDSHKIYADWAKNPVNNVQDAPWDAQGDTFNNFGRYGDPVYAGGIQTGYSDFWPGYYSRTHVGSTRRDYRAVMQGIRAGRIWVAHGDLIAGLDARVAVKGDRRPGATLGGTLAVREGDRAVLTVTIALATRSNFAQFRPKLNRVDLVQGDITGPAADRDVFTTPSTKVVRSWDTSTNSGSVTLTYDLGKVDRPYYVRLRGTDANRTAVGFLGAGVDPVGPAMDVVGDADPWADLWFYSNPIFVVPTRRS